MGKLTETTQWEDDIYQLETSDPVLGGPDGVSNKPQKQLANRTQWLKQQLETTNSALANHAKSRNHPDASLTAKGFVQLYSGVMSDSEILAATPKAVKIAMDNANARLAKDQNLADLTNVPLARQSLQLGNSATLNTGTTTGTVAAGDDSRITGAMQKSQNGADVPDKPAFLQNVGAFPVTGGRLNGPLGIGTDNVLGGDSIVLGDNDTGFKQDGDGVLSIYANNARVGYIDGNGLHMLTDIHFDNARMTTNGDIFSSVWGNNWLSIWMTNQLNTRGTIDWINSELAARDNNINARATWDYVNQTFARKNTASLAVNGWFRDASTGWIFQWGITPFAGNTTITVSLPIPFPNQGFLALGGPASALWYGEDDNSSYAALLNNSQLQVTTDTNVGTAWIVMGH
ncbi:phage tail protein [Salmonella enterica]